MKNACVALFKYLHCFTLISDQLQIFRAMISGPIHEDQIKDIDMSDWTGHLSSSKRFPRFLSIHFG